MGGGYGFLSLNFAITNSSLAMIARVSVVSAVLHRGAQRRSRRLVLPLCGSVTLHIASTYFECSLFIERVFVVGNFGRNPNLNDGDKLYSKEFGDRAHGERGSPAVLVVSDCSRNHGHPPCAQCRNVRH